VLIAALATSVGAVAQTVPRALFYHLGEPVADPSACALAAGAKLAELGYRVAKPTTSAHGDAATGKFGVSVICEHPDGPLLMINDLIKLKRQAEPEATVLRAALQSAIWPRRSSTQQAALAPAWSTEPSQRYRAMRRVVIDRKVRCLTLARRALGPLGFESGASDEEGLTVSAYSPSGQYDGVSLSCETPGEVLVAITGERDAAIAMASARASMRRVTSTSPLPANGPCAPEPPATAARRSGAGRAPA
jgi:hypothetical protein